MNECERNRKHFSPQIIRGTLGCPSVPDRLFVVDGRDDPCLHSGAIRSLSADNGKVQLFNSRLGAFEKLLSPFAPRKGVLSRSERRQTGLSFLERSLSSAGYTPIIFPSSMKCCPTISPAASTECRVNQWPQCFGSRRMKKSVWNRHQAAECLMLIPYRCQSTANSATVVDDD